MLERYRDLKTNALSCLSISVIVISLTMGCYTKEEQDLVTAVLV